jgi:hypothetical protein
MPSGVALRMCPFLVLRFGVILGSFDILVDIGVPAEKEVIR